MSKPPELVSMTHRLAQAELLADNLRSHLATLPVQGVEASHLLFQYDALLLELRAEIADWQKLAMTCAEKLNMLIRAKEPLKPAEYWKIGELWARVLQRSPAVYVFSAEALDKLDETWPHLGLNTEFWPQIPMLPITNTTKTTNDAGL